MTACGACCPALLDFRPPLIFCQCLDKACHQCCVRKQCSKFCCTMTLSSNDSKSSFSGIKVFCLPSVLDLISSQMAIMCKLFFSIRKKHKSLYFFSIYCICLLPLFLPPFCRDLLEFFKEICTILSHASWNTNTMSIADVQMFSRSIVQRRPAVSLFLTCVLGFIFSHKAGMQTSFFQLIIPFFTLTWRMYLNNSK